MVTWVPRESWCAPHLSATGGRRRGIVCSHRDTWLRDLGKRRRPIKNWTGQKAKQVPGSGVMRILNLVRAAFPFPVATNISKNKVTLRGLKLFFLPHKGNITQRKLQQVGTRAQGVHFVLPHPRVPSVTCSPPPKALGVSTPPGSGPSKTLQPLS